MTDTSHSPMHPRAMTPGSARARAQAGAVDHLLGAAVAAARDDRDRHRSVPRACPGSVSGFGCRRSRGRRRSSSSSSSPPRPGAADASCVSPSRARRACAGSTARPAITHRPATAIADELATSRARSVVRRRCGAPMSSARCSRRSRLKAGRPAPRLALRDPMALRALVVDPRAGDLLRRRRRARAAHHRGLRLAGRGGCRANFRIDAWVSPPFYTGKPPVILPGLRPGEKPAPRRPP